MPDPAPQAPKARADLPLVWLASYPKSGNTWVRVLLAGIFPDERPAADDAIAAIGFISSDRRLFDSATGLPSADLTAEEIDLLRPDFYRSLPRSAGAGPTFVKAHDAWYRNAAGAPIFPADRSRGAILMVRHPMDVAWSYAHHRGDPDCTAAIAAMADPGHVMAGGGKRQFHQRTGGWTAHYLSWTGQEEIPVLVVRYEDMVADTATQLRRMLGFIGETAIDEGAIERALALARFDRLQAIEKASGFAERPPAAERFFRSGRVGEGVRLLPRHLKDRIWEQHGRVMAELGYGFDGLAQ